MALPAPIRRIITNGAMGIAQMFNRGDPANNEKISLLDVIASIPLIIALLPTGIDELLSSIYNTSNAWLVKTVTAGILILLAPFVDATDKLIDTIADIAEELKELKDRCIELTDKVIQFINHSIDKIRQFFNKVFNQGYRYAQQNPLITVDTYKLRNYAQALSGINRRVLMLDGRLNSLYLTVGLMGLWNLLQADLLTHYSWRLSQCCAYLNETANDFDRTENELEAKL